MSNATGNGRHKARPSASPRATARALAERRAVLQARSQALRTAFDLEVRGLDLRVGRRVDQAVHWLGVARRAAGIGVLVLPLLMSRRSGRRGLARGVHLLSRAVQLAPLALGLVQSLRGLSGQRSQATGAPPQPAAGQHD